MFTLKQNWAWYLRIYAVFICSLLPWSNWVHVLTILMDVHFQVFEIASEGKCSEIAQIAAFKGYQGPPCSRRYSWISACGFNSTWFLAQAYLYVQCTKDRMSPQAVIRSKGTNERGLADMRATVTDLSEYPLCCYPGDGIIQTKRCACTHVQQKRQKKGSGVGYPLPGIRWTRICCRTGKSGLQSQTRSRGE